MGESLNEKVYYTNVNDNEYTELKGVNEINIQQEIDGIHIYFKRNKNIKDLGGTLSFVISSDSMKRFMKKFGLNHISKKRAKKLLMSQGFNRNEANNIAININPRTEGNIKLFQINKKEKK